MPRKFILEEFVSAVSVSTSKRQVLKILGLAEAGGNYASLNRLLQELQLDTSHWLGQAHLRGKPNPYVRQKELAEFLVEKSFVGTSHLRKRLIREKIIDNKCYECGLTEWRGRPLSLELEHKNGIRTDNRIENLIILCPNCHSQTSTYRGRNKKKTLLTPCSVARLIEKEAEVPKCTDCGSKVYKGSLRCRKCAMKLRPAQYRINWPADNELIELVQSSSYLAVSKKLGVSDTAIRKRLKRNIDKC